MKQKLLYKYLIIIICACAWSGEAWGYSSTKLNVSVEGGGLVAVTSSTSAPAASAYQSSASLEQGPHGFWDTLVTDTYYIWVKPNSGFTAVSMSGDFSSSDAKTSGQYYTVSFKGKTSAVSKSVKITFKTTYTFSATAKTNGASYGTATASVDPASVPNTTKTSASSTATFEATPKSGYEFVGWGTSSTTTSYESSANPYKPTINGVAGSTASKTLYAIFKPVFNFTATANKINGSYGEVTKSVTAKILGNPGETSKSTTATFTATPNTNCTFEGWYTDAAHTNKVSSDFTYTPTITNNSVGSTANLTLYAWFKSNQTLTWTQTDYDRNVVNGMTSTGVAAATASSRLTITYSSSDDGVATVNNNGDVTGVSTGDVTITATQAGNDEFNPISATREFTVINKYQATFTPSGFRSGSGLNLTTYVGDTPTITVANTAADFTYVSSDPTVVSIAKSGDVITLTALKEGTSTITLNQPNNTTHYAASAPYNITVTKVPNNLAVSLSATNAQVDGTINVTFTGRSNEVTPIVGTVTDQILSSNANNGTDVISYANGIITAKNAGSARITFTQAETDKYEGFTSSTYDITVTKLGNPITITLAGGSATNIKLKYGATASLSYTYANTSGAAPTVTRTSGSYTTYSNGTITAGNTQGTDVYEIRQAETYRYEAGYASFTIRVNNSDEAVGYVLYDESEYSQGTGAGVMHTYTLSGPGGTLSYEVTRDLWAIYYHMYVESSPDNSTWTQIHDNTDIDDRMRWREFSDTVSEKVRYIRFRFPSGGDLTKYIRNTKVTRRTYVHESHNKSSEAFGTVYSGDTKTISITVNYSSTNGGNINISSNNPHFVPSISEIAVESNKTATSPGGTQYICGVDGTKTFTVTYTPDPNQLGEESATITIGDLFYSQQFTLTATAAKQANTLAVIGTQNLKVDDTVGSVYSGKNSTATLTPTLSREGVITYDASTNKITAVGEGTATLTFTQPENDYYYGATKTVTVNVTKYDQTITWDNELASEDRTLEVGDVLFTNTAMASSGLAITYSSSNSTALEVNATTGALTARAGGANIAITATQAGNYKYNEASITRYFTVIQKEEVVVTTTLSESGTNIFPIGDPDVTIRTNAKITEDALTISGDDDVLSATFGSNTFTLTALAEGTVTLTLTRVETEDYYALNKTYTIRVVKPVLALDPSAVPVINYSSYSSVLLNRTLKAGYSTIALPFATTVEAIVGDSYDEDDDWVAQLQTVTHTEADNGTANEYTLYFQKVDGGVITANQPYVLHLSAAVVNPTWTDLTDGITVAAASAGEKAATNGYSGYGGWVMHANYDVDFPMSGKYGIVNSAGGLMLGGSGSTLAAYTAYIAPPAQVNNAPRLRVAYVDTDGTTTVVDDLPFDNDADAQHIAIYGPDGKRRSRLQPGVNIVRQADGTVRKVQR